MDALDKAEQHERLEKRLESYREIGQYIKSERVSIRETLRMVWRTLFFTITLKKPGLLIFGMPILVLRHLGGGVRSFIAENFPIK